MTAGRRSRTATLLDLPHHDGSELYVSSAAPALGDVVEVRVRVPRSWPLRSLTLRSVQDGEPRPVPAEVEREDDVETWWRTDLLVHNPVTSYRFLLDGAPGAPTPYAWLNAAGVQARDVTDAHDFRVVTYAAPPAWVTDAVVYQVFPDRFARSGVDRPAPEWAIPAAWEDDVVPEGHGVAHQWFGGDLDGVAAHLDHLVSLGVDVLYLTPVFTAGSNHRYDARTFDHVDPVLGGDEALLRLVAAAHGRGLRVMTDLTTNHTGDGHEWFTAAVRDPAAPSGDFYRFREHPDDYVAWLDVPTLPKLEHTSPALRQALYEGQRSVVGRWLHDPWAVDGWRIDVANMTGRYADVDLAHDVARAVRRTMAEADAETGRGTWLLAEHGHDASGDLAGDGWHGTMNYAGFSRPVWTWLTDPEPTGDGGRGFMGMPVAMPRLPGGSVMETMRDFAASMPWRSLLHSSTMLGSHDTPRIRTAVGGGRGTPDEGGPLAGAADAATEAAARGRHLAGLALLATLPGVPMVFAGDEIGLTGTNGEHSRTPFPWTHPDRWDDATLAAYRAWIALRRQQPALRRGGLRWVAAQADSLTFLREHPEGTVLVHVARADHHPVRLPAHLLLGGSAGDNLPPALYGDPLVGEDDGTATLPSFGPAAHAYLLGVS